MAKVERFEVLIAWQKARKLTEAIYAMTQQGAVARDFGVRDQVQRASVSVMSNIAEGVERGSRGEFHQFLAIAKASCAEVRSLLYVALDAHLIDQQVFDRLLPQAQEVAAIVGGLRASVARQLEPRLKALTE